MSYKTTYDFISFKIIGCFGDGIRIDIITMDMTNNEQEKLTKKIAKFSSKFRQRNFNMKKEIKVLRIVHWHF